MPVRTVPVTRELLRAMARDVTVASLTRPPVVATATVVLVLVVTTVLLPGRSAGTPVFLMPLVLGLAVAIAVAITVITAVSTRRALAASLPGVSARASGIHS